jgi:hypothetical protein
VEQSSEIAVNQVEKKKYPPRLHERGYGSAIRFHVKRVQLLQKNNLLPDNWRQWLQHYVDTLLKLCPHTTCTIVEVEGPHGIWGVEICNDCGTLTARECPHVCMIWHEEGQALICSNCGVDGT